MIVFPEPLWLVKLPEPEQTKARWVFRIKLAALYNSEGGTLRELSERIGYDGNTFSAKPRVTPETAIKLEKILGRDLFPREYFRPDLFLVGE